MDTDIVIIPIPLPSRFFVFFIILNHMTLENQFDIIFA